jgi:hypothetical protein
VALFIGARGVRRVRQGRRWQRRSRARKGKTRCACGRRRLGGTGESDGTANDGRNSSGSCRVCHGYGGESLKRTTAMVPLRAFERVYGLSG